MGDTLQILFGPLGARYGPKPFLLLALLLALPIALIYGGVLTLGVGAAFCLLYIAVGAAYPNSALTGFLLKPKSPGRMISLIMSASYVGYALGPFVMRLLHQTEGTSLSLLLPLAFLLFLGLLYRFPKKLQGNPKAKVGLHHLRPHWRPLALLWFCQFCLQGITLAILLLIPEYFAERHLSAGICLGGGHFAVIMGTALSTFFGRGLADRPHPFAIMGSAATIGLLGFALLLFVSLPPPLLLATLTLIGGSIGLLVPLNIALGNRIVPGKEGLVSGLLMGGAWGLGGVVPLLAGWIALSHPLSLSFLFIGSLLLIPLAAALLLPRITPISAPPSRSRISAPFPMIPIEWEEELALTPSVFSLDNTVWDQSERVPELPEPLLKRLRKEIEGRRKKVAALPKPALDQFPRREK